MKNNSKESNKIKEPSKFAIKFANSVFVLGILHSGLIGLYAMYKIYNKPDYTISTVYFSYLLFATLIAILLALGLRKLSEELKVNMSVLFVTAGILLYGFETYLEFFHEKPQDRKAIAEKMGTPFDTRTKIDVIEDLRSSGRKAYPNLSPALFIASDGLNTSKGKIYPLGGISKITTILANESGFYPIVETDEHGFNNPKGLYETNKVDIILTGDSYTEGLSVDSDETIGAVLRSSGFNAISIGKRGSGPLIELAALKEYAEPLKPKVVLWLYFPANDIDGLSNEIKSPFLLKYLNENDFSQNLISRQEEIDSLLLDYVEVSQESEKTINHWTIRILKLTNLRIKISLTSKSEPKIEVDLKNIFQKSNKIVSSWGGKMYFVYLPDFNRYSKGIEHPMREFVLHTINELEIPIIDIHKEVFVPHSDPVSLFPFRMYYHYNAEGYRLVAEAISKRLKADEIIPSNSKN